MRCTGDRRNTEFIKIRNVKLLAFEQTNYVSTITPNFYLENIEYIENIPGYTFSQYIKPTHSAGCVVPTKDFGNFSFTNGSIGTIESGAFYMPSGFGKFELFNVNIKRMQSSAIYIEYDKKGEFLLNNCSVDVMEHLAIRLSVRNATISENKFVEISSGAINGSIENFSFNDNSVDTLQPQAFSILTKNVVIQSNKFQYMKSGALEKISPGLLADSGRNFASLKFYYLFKENYVSNFDAGAINPDIDAYNNVASDVQLTWNQFNCQCHNIGKDCHI